MIYDKKAATLDPVDQALVVVRRNVELALVSVLAGLIGGTYIFLRVPLPPAARTWAVVFFAGAGVVIAGGALRVWKSPPRFYLAAVHRGLENVVRRGKTPKVLSRPMVLAIGLLVLTVILVRVHQATMAS